MSELYELFSQHPRISTDTRRIEPDSIFFALRGDTFDGNRFVAEALEKGAAYAVSDDPQVAASDERQRIVLARVLLGRPSLIVLDEATSALDYESETAFHDAIASLGKDAAVVLIAHHGTTIAMADSAVVLEKGSVVEQGLISELAGRDSGYLSGMTGQR